MTKTLALSQAWRRRLAILAGIYMIMIGLMCFLPQGQYPSYKDFTTPGIVQIGRLYFLPVPFNSLINADQVDNLSDFLLILMQNIANIFLLYPFVFLMMILKVNWRDWRRVLIYSFLLSSTIESTQLLLDWLIDARRVFEIDDLWTNSLGGLLAYWTYLWLVKVYEKYQARKRAS